MKRLAAFLGAFCAAAGAFLAHAALEGVNATEGMHQLLASGALFAFGFGLIFVATRPGMREVESGRESETRGHGANVTRVSVDHERLARAERVAAWRDIAQRMAHEIKNPLSPIRTSIETLRKAYERRLPEFDVIFEESTRATLDSVERLTRIVSEFSDFARMPRPKVEAVDVRDVIHQVAATLGREQVAVDLGSSTPLVMADKEQLTQVVLNLVQNGLQAASGKGTGARVRIRTASDAHGGAQMTIEDNGPGIEPDERELIFKPYYTTKSGGTGLGLAIVDRIVSDHGGTIRVDPSDLGGARFTISLTREGPPPEASSTQSMARNALFKK